MAKLLGKVRQLLSRVRNETGDSVACLSLLDA